MIGPTYQKNWLTFGYDPVSHIDSVPLFHFHHHCGIANFGRFISIFAARCDGISAGYGALKMQDRKMTDNEISGGGEECRTKISLTHSLLRLTS